MTENTRAPCGVVFYNIAQNLLMEHENVSIGSLPQEGKKDK